MWLRYGHALFLDAFKMKFNGLVDEFKHLFLCFRRRDAARKIRNVCAETTRAFLNDNQVTHVIFSLEPGRLHNVVECVGRDINTGFSRNSYCSRFGWMMELAMTAFLSHLQPAVSFNQRNEFLDLHAVRIALNRMSCQRGAKRSRQRVDRRGVNSGQRRYREA